MLLQQRADHPLGPLERLARLGALAQPPVLVGHPVPGARQQEAIVARAAHRVDVQGEGLQRAVGELADHLGAAGHVGERGRDLGEEEARHLPGLVALAPHARPRRRRRAPAAPPGWPGPRVALPAVTLEHPARHLAEGVLVGLHPAAGEEVLQLLRQLARVRVAVVAVPGQRALADGHQLRRGAGLEGEHPGGRLAAHLGQHVPGALPQVGRAAGEDLEEHRAQAPHVGARVEVVAAALRLLRRHVRGRAHRPQVAAAGEIGGELHGAAVAIGPAHHPRQPPVHHVGLAVRPEHHVLRLEIAVDDVAVVRGGHGAAGGEEIGHQRQPPLQAAGVGERLGQGAAADLAHGVIHGAVAPAAQLVHGHDRGVLELPGDAGLAQEARLEVAHVERVELHVLGDLAVQLLHRHVARQEVIARHHHPPCPAAAQLLQAFPCGRCRRCSGPALPPRCSPASRGCRRRRWSRASPACPGWCPAGGWRPGRRGCPARGAGGSAG